MTLSRKSQGFIRLHRVCTAACVRLLDALLPWNAEWYAWIRPINQPWRSQIHTNLLLRLLNRCTHIAAMNLYQGLNPRLYKISTIALPFFVRVATLIDLNMISKRMITKKPCLRLTLLLPWFIFTLWGNNCTSFIHFFRILWYLHWVEGKIMKIQTQLRGFILTARIIQSILKNVLLIPLNTQCDTVWSTIKKVYKDIFILKYKIIILTYFTLTINYHE